MDLLMVSWASASVEELVWRLLVSAEAVAGLCLVLVQVVWLLLTMDLVVQLLYLDRSSIEAGSMSHIWWEHDIDEVDVMWEHNFVDVDIL